MRRLSDRFVEAAEACPDLPQLRALLGEAVAARGFQHFARLDHARLTGTGPGLVRIDNYPERWVEELLASGDAADDPVHLASRRTNVGFGWFELDRLVPLSRRHRRILERSRTFGLGEGFTIPFTVPGEPSGSCSFAVRAGFELPRARLRCAELIGAHAFRAARRILPRPAPLERPHLSRRELECLMQVARGKSDTEIAMILGISSETARQYVKRARAAYDVVSRTQLVVHGLRDSWISFEDAIPPNG